MRNGGIGHGFGWATLWRLVRRHIAPELLLKAFLEHKPERVSFRRFYTGKPPQK